MLEMDDLRYEYVIGLENVFNDELEHQEDLCVYRQNAVDNFFEKRQEYYFLGKEMRLDMVYNAMYLFVEKFNTNQYLIGELRGAGASGRLPVCLEVVRYLTQKIERHINEKIRYKFIYHLDDRHLSLKIDTTQYNHSWDIHNERTGEIYCLGYWIEKTSKIPDCFYLVELFKRFIIIKLIKIQSLIRMHLINSERNLGLREIV